MFPAARDLIGLLNLQMAYFKLQFIQVELKTTPALDSRYFDYETLRGLMLRKVELKETGYSLLGNWYRGSNIGLSTSQGGPVKLSLMSANNGRFEERDIINFRFLKEIN